MEKVSYYPGCTLKTIAKNFEDSAIQVMEVLGYELTELPRWNCCGTVYSLASDDLIHKVAPIRNLIRVKEQGSNKVVTLCSMCYNTLKQANTFFKSDKEASKKINDFMDREIDYNGDVEVMHLLTFLHDEVGFERIAKNAKEKLEGMKVAPYYGCLLLRPKGAEIDDPENPTIMENLFNSLGVETIDFPYRNECCGSYNTVNAKDLILERTYKFVTLARELGADIITTTCPLCQFNLDFRQKNVKEKYPDFYQIPVLYFTQLIGVALGIALEKLRFDLNFVNPITLLRRKKLACQPT